MENNCLVKKLKSSVNIVSPIIGYAVIAELEGSNIELRQDANVSFYNAAGVVKLVGDGYIIKNNVNAGKEVNWGSFSDTGYGIHINSGKVIIQATYNDMRATLSLKGTFDSSCAVKIVDLSSAILACNADNKTINTLEFISLNMKGNIEDVSGHPFSYLQLRSVNPSLVTGNIENISRGGTSAIGSIRLENHPLITGSLETFLDHICANAANGSFYLTIKQCPNITYNGQPVTNLSKTVTVSSGSWSMS